MAPRIPASLNWLIKTRARLDGELQKTKASAAKAQRLIERLNSIQQDLTALDRALGLHEIKVNPENIAAVRSHYVRVKVPHGELTRSILLCLRLNAGRHVQTRELVAFVGARFADLNAPARDVEELYRSVRYRLKNLARDGLVQRHHSGGAFEGGRWSIAKPPP